MVHACPMAEPEPNAPAPLPKLRLRDQDRFTGKNCPPDKRKAIVELIKTGAPKVEIAQALACSPQTVVAVRDADLGPEWRKESSNGLKRVARDLIYHFQQAPLQDIPWAVKPVMLGIVLDKIAQLDGEPQMVVGHRHSVDLSGLQTSLSAPPEIDVTPISGTSTAPSPELTQ